MGLAAATGDAAAGRVDQDHRGVYERGERQTAGVSAPGPERGVRIRHLVDDRADRLPHPVLGVERHQPRVLAYPTGRIDQACGVEGVPRRPLTGMGALLLARRPVAVALGHRGQLPEVARHDQPLAGESGGEPGRGKVDHASLVDHHDIDLVEQLPRLDGLGHGRSEYSAMGANLVLDALAFPPEFVESPLEKGGGLDDGLPGRNPRHSGIGRGEGSAGLGRLLLARRVATSHARDVLPGPRRLVLFMSQSGLEVTQFRRSALREESGRLPHLLHLQPQLRCQGVRGRHRLRRCGVIAAGPSRLLCAGGQVRLQVPDTVVQDQRRPRALELIGRRADLPVDALHEQGGDPGRVDLVAVTAAQRRQDDAPGPLDDPLGKALLVLQQGAHPLKGLVHRNVRGGQEKDLESLAETALDDVADDIRLPGAGRPPQEQHLTGEGLCDGVTLTWVQLEPRPVRHPPARVPGTAGARGAPADQPARVVRVDGAVLAAGRLQTLGQHGPVRGVVLTDLDVRGRRPEIGFRHEPYGSVRSTRGLGRIPCLPGM